MACMEIFSGEKKRGTLMGKTREIVELKGQKFANVVFGTLIRGKRYWDLHLTIFRYFLLFFFFVTS